MHRIKFLSLLLIPVLFSGSRPAKENFKDYFADKTLRIDYQLIGDAHNTQFILQQLKERDHWAGPQKIDFSEGQKGNLRVNIFDSARHTLLFQKGSNSLYEEWQATPKAQKESRAYYQVELIPFPLRTIQFVLQARNKESGQFEDIHSCYINPENYAILKEPAKKTDYSCYQMNGKSKKKIDLAFLAEGYTAAEMDKFEQDARRIWDYMISIPPFDKHKKDFNIWMVKSPSEESGTDLPHDGIYKNTVLNSSFYTFESTRYLTTSDLKTMHDVAEVVPYDHIIVLVNSPVYGGGGFYNYYSISSVDNILSNKVCIHEFGHGFVGLADEYYNTNDTFVDTTHTQIEPWEPNITTLVDFDSKWAHLLGEYTPVPTPRTPEWEETLGVFEGGGYSAKGIYSPFQDCRMKSNDPEGFCPACSEAIEETIRYYTR